MKKDIQKRIKELTLLLLWLTSWDESKKNRQLKRLGSVYRAWKGYDFEILNELKEDSLIDFSYRTKSVYFTEKGIEEAKKLREFYLEKENNGK